MAAEITRILQAAVPFLDAKARRWVWRRLQILRAMGQGLRDDTNADGTVLPGRRVVLCIRWREFTSQLAAELRVAPPGWRREEVLTDLRDLARAFREVAGL